LKSYRGIAQSHDKQLPLRRSADCFGTSCLTLYPDGWRYCQTSFSAR